MRAGIVLIAAAVLAAALVHRFYHLGGPYFDIPETVQDHVNATPYPSRDAIVMCRRGALLIPRDAVVTVILPSQAPNYDPTLYFSAVGMMPHHRIVPPYFEAKEPPKWVITVREPLQRAEYRQHAEFPEGFIYMRQ